MSAPLEQPHIGKHQDQDPDIYRPKLFLKWKRDFRRPKKVEGGEKKRKITIELSEDEYNLIRSYAQGCSVDALAREWQCHKSTICRSLRCILLPVFHQEKEQ